MSANVSFTEPWTGTLTHLEWSTPRLLLLAFINIPILSIVVNALWQLLPRPKSQPPLVWHWIPYLGSAPAYGRDPIGFFSQNREKYGNCFTFILLGRRVTVTLGAQGNDYVLGGKHTQLAAEEVYSPLTTPVFGKGVVYDCPNEKLMEQKKFVKVSLTIDKFRSYVGMIEDEVKEYLNGDPEFRIWQTNDINEWGSFTLDVFAELTILTASRTLQGREVRESLNKNFAQIYTDLDRGFTPLHWLMPGLPLPSYRKRDAAHKKMSSFYQSILKNRRENLAEHEEDDDVMASLMKQKYRDGTSIPDPEIAHILIALLMAGQHSSSGTLAWAVLHIAGRPDIQEALYKEQMESFGTPDGGMRDIDYEKLRELKVLDAVVRETLRIHPPIHSIMRMARDDIPVPATLSAPSEDGVYVVPKGDIVLASPLISQVDPAVWEDSDTWEPLRWYDEKGVAAQANKQYNEGEKVDFGFGLVSKGTDSPYLPFGAGRHRCIGEQFAYLQICTVISAMVRRCEFRLEGGVPKPDYASLLVHPLPARIMYRRRKFD